jgi:MFS family permease
MFGWLEAFAQDRPTIAEKAPQDLAEYLLAFPGSFEAQLMIGLTIAGVIGMSAHYVVKWARREIEENLFCYMWHNRRSTFASFCAYISVAIGAIIGDAFMGELGGFVGWKVVFWMGISNGFAIDAIVNKTERARWTPTLRKKITKRAGSPRA